MASSNTTTPHPRLADGHAQSQPDSTSKDMPPPPYDTNMPNKFAFRPLTNQYGGLPVYGANSNAAFAAPPLTGPGFYSPGMDQKQQEWNNLWHDPENASAYYSKKMGLGLDEDINGLPSMSQTSNMFQAFGVGASNASHPGQSVQAISTQGPAFFQQVVQSQGVPHHQAHPSYSYANNFAGNPPTSIINYGHNTRILNTVNPTVNQYTREAPQAFSGPPQYPLPQFGAPQYGTQAVLTLPGGNSKQGATAKKTRPRAAKKRAIRSAPGANSQQRTRPLVPASPFPTGLASNVQSSINNHTSQVLLRVNPPQALNVVVPPAATRIRGQTNVSARANNPNEKYGNLIKNYPTPRAMPPLNIDIGMVEICTFFPNWVMLPEVAVRAQMNTWKREDLAMAQLVAEHGIQNLTADGVRTAGRRIQKQISAGGKAMFNITGENTRWRAEIPTQRGYTGNEDLTVNNWHFESQYWGGTKDVFGHIVLNAVYSRIPRANWPQGEDRLTLTKCLEFAANNPTLDLDTSHLGWIMQTLGLPPGSQLNAQHDKDARTRFVARFPRP